MIVVVQVLAVACAAVRFVETPLLAVAVTAAVVHCDGASEQGRSSSSYQLRRRSSTYYRATAACGRRRRRRLGSRGNR